MTLGRVLTPLAMLTAVIGPVATFTVIGMVLAVVLLRAVNPGGVVR